MSFGVGCRRGSDLAWLWLWRRLAATALIRPLAWEPSYAVGTALEKTKKEKERKALTILFTFYNEIFLSGLVFLFFGVLGGFLVVFFFFFPF